MKRKILIIDDEVDQCLLIEKFLTLKNYVVDCAHSLKDGLKKIYEIRPDSLLLDNNLPDGLGWLQAAAIHQAFPEMHITLISANIVIPYPVANDTFDYMEKPISFSALEQHL